MRPLSISSVRPPTRVATTGSPNVIASAAAMPKVSAREGWRYSTASQPRSVGVLDVAAKGHVLLETEGRGEVAEHLSVVLGAWLGVAVDVEVHPAAVGDQRRHGRKATSTPFAGWSRAAVTMGPVRPHAPGRALSPPRRSERGRPRGVVARRWVSFSEPRPATARRPSRRDGRRCAR